MAWRQGMWFFSGADNGCGKVGPTEHHLITAVVHVSPDLDTVGRATEEITNLPYDVLTCVCVCVCVCVCACVQQVNIGGIFSSK